MVKCLLEIVKWPWQAINDVIFMEIQKWYYQVIKDTMSIGMN